MAPRCLSQVQERKEEPASQVRNQKAPQREAFREGRGISLDKESSSSLEEASQTKAFRISMGLERNSECVASVSGSDADRNLAVRAGVGLGAGNAAWTVAMHEREVLQACEPDPLLKTQSAAFCWRLFATLGAWRQFAIAASRSHSG